MQEVLEEYADSDQVVWIVSGLRAVMPEQLFGENVWQTLRNVRGAYGTLLDPPTNGGAIRPNAGPVAIGLFEYTLSEASIPVREQANAAMKKIAERKGLGKFMKLTETQGGYASHPLGGCRMADSAEFGVVDHRCEVFGNEGLFCMDSSAIPTSLGVNPSLTISAVCERAAHHLTARAQDYGLPRRPEAFRHRTPGRFLGERYVPKRGGDLKVVGG